MASVKYHGEFPEGQEEIVQHGYTFERGGKAVDVKDKDLLSRFATNRFFEVSGESDKDDVKAGQAEAEEAETETLRAWLDEHNVPFRANASLKSLREAREDYEKRQAAAQED
jgi:hypothetical protein